MHISSTKNFQEALLGRLTTEEATISGYKSAKKAAQEKQD